MTDQLAALSKLKENLKTLNTLAEEYESDVPQKLAEQIDNHVKAISLTRQVITGEIAEADWKAAMEPLGLVIDSGEVINIDTGGGAYIKEGVEVQNGDFVGRDKIENIQTKVEHHWHVDEYTGPTTMRLDYRQEISGLLDYHNNRFVAREPELKQIFAFTSPKDGEAKAPYLLLKAKGGYGKSTLMAHLIYLAQNGRWQGTTPHIVFFFIRQRAGRHSPTSFLQALNSQLLDLLEVSGGILGTLDKLQVQFSQLWGAVQTIASPDKPLLLLIDGLDEMALSSETQPITIADLLPIPSSDHVKVIVSSRPNPPPKERVGREHPLRKAPELELTTFEMGSVLRVVERTLREKNLQLHVDFKAQPETAVETITEAVMDLTGGEPLFTRFMAEEIITGGLAAIAELKKNPPEDVEDYFRVQFEALDDLADSDITWDILKFLVVARSGLALDEIAGLLEKPRRKIRVALENLGRFLLGDERVELMHARLHERVREEFSSMELETGRQRLLAWCRGFQAQGWPADTPSYVLDEYGSHLADAGAAQELYALIDAPYMRRQFDACRSYAGFVRDAELALALAAAGKDPAWVPLCRTSLAIATLGSAATNAPPAAIGVLAQFGHMDEAVGYTELIQNPLNRAEAYGRIALACLNRNERQEAAGWVRAAIESIEGKELLGELEDAFLPMTAVLDALGDMNGINFLLDTAHQSDVSDWKAVSMAEIILILCRKGYLGKVEEVIHANAAEANLHRRLLEQTADSDKDLSEVLKFIIEGVQSVLGGEYNDKRLNGILAVAYNRLGNMDEAEAAADRAIELLFDEDGKIDTGSTVWLVLLFRASQLSSHAERVNQLIQHEIENFGTPTGNRFSNGSFNYGYALQEYAKGLAQLGDEAELIKLLKKANEEAYYDLEFEGLYVALASALAKIGQADLAMEAAALIESEDSDGSFEELAWLGIVDGLCRRGMLQQAEVALERNRFRSRVASMGILASTWAKVAAGEPDNTGAAEKAVKWAYAAIAEASSLAGEHFQAAAYANCAVALAEVGQEDRARLVVGRARAETEGLRSGGRTLNVVNPIIAAFLAVGDITAARTYAASVTWSADNTLEPIVRAAYAAGDINQALELWYTIIDAVRDDKYQYNIVTKICLIADLAFLLGEGDYGRQLLQDAIARLKAADQQWRDGNYWRGVTLDELGAYIKVCLDHNLADFLEPGLELLHQQPIWEVLEKDWLPVDIDPPESLKEEPETLDRDLFTLSNLLPLLPDNGDKAVKAAELGIKHAIVAAQNSTFSVPGSNLTEAVERLLKTGKLDFLRESLHLTIGNASHGWQVADTNGYIATGAARAGSKDMAVEYLVKGIVQARLSGRLAFFSALSSGAAVFTFLDQSDLLWQVYQTCEEVDSWWDGKR